MSNGIILTDIGKTYFNDGQLVSTVFFSCIFTRYYETMRMTDNKMLRTDNIFDAIKNHKELTKETITPFLSWRIVWNVDYITHIAGDSPINFESTAN